MERVEQYIKGNLPLIAGVAAATCVVISMGLRSLKRARPTTPKDTVILHTVAPVGTVPSTSPFPLKLECYFRILNIPYKREHDNVFSKKGKFPWITYNGEDVCDSQFIIEYLNKKLGVNLNANLSNEQLAAANAIRIMVDEHLYWCAGHFRWIRGYNSPEMRTLFPFWPLRLFISSRVKNQMYAQGLGRHSFEELLHIMKQDLQILQDFLGNKTYMMGNEPTEVDCSVFGILVIFVDSFTKDDVVVGLIEREYPGLYEYLQRLKETFWPDWDIACKKSDELTIKL